MLSFSIFTVWVGTNFVAEENIGRFSDCLLIGQKFPSKYIHQYMHLRVLEHVLLTQMHVATYRWNSFARVVLYQNFVLLYSGCFQRIK